VATVFKVCLVPFVKYRTTYRLTILSTDRSWWTHVIQTSITWPWPHFNGLLLLFIVVSSLGQFRHYYIT